MTEQFISNDVYKDREMTFLKNHQFNCSTRGPTDSSLNDMKFCLNTTKPIQEDFDEIMKQTNCPFCRLPKTHCDRHFLSSCKLVKKYRYNHKDDPTTDETRADFKKKEAQRKKTAAANKKDADELKKAKNDKKAREGREKAEAKKAHVAAAEAGDATNVGKGGKEAGIEKEKAAAIKANIDSKTQPKAGTGRRVTVAAG